MGNNSSSARGHHDDTVDFGSLVPQGVYTGPQDWNQAIVAQLIVQRKLAPFYRPLEEYEESWDDEQILASRKELPENLETASHSETASAASSSKPDVSSSFRSHGKRPSAQKDTAKFSEAAVYRGALECPICFLVRPISNFQCSQNSSPFFLFNFLPVIPFRIRHPLAHTESPHIHTLTAPLGYATAEHMFVCHVRGLAQYYPANINYSRCCGQAICTECFVQIKRSEPTTTHLVSDPAACPYCVQEHFGVVYTPPPWRTGIGSDGSSPPSWPDSPKGGSPSSEVAGTRSRRRKSFGADSPEVVTIDQIRPDWEAKLAAVRAQAQRRANRRIIMRQVGDRLIPVGVTSGRVHALTEDGGDAEGSRSGSRRRRRNQGQNPALDRLLGQVDIAGQDLEELMVMEAMRLSLLEHEQQQQRQREEEERNRRNGETSERGRSTEAGNNTSLNTPGQRSASAVPLEPVGERIDHRPSSSLPNDNPLGGLHANGNWRRPSSQISTLSTATNTTNTLAAILSTDDPRPPLSSPSAQTTGTDGDTVTISSNSSEIGHSSPQPTPVVDGDEGGEVNYAILPSSPESPDQSHPFHARSGDDETATRTR
ncbi:hypothetical protein BDM02DRAFT_3183113 [Thelephora ganbajun]|uniref:Uncharacterized protein n=1 Tax=Thelephora ganbajun TaxID=370292 RepID=A0ACB6ZU84_THEGA|nr:hypothetical protein BDM02DRAFT_3183113 [Thelephora ganbajun]